MPVVILRNTELVSGESSHLNIKFFRCFMVGVES